jgi:aryl-alcohol dehydrogenase-like predicted oxidoreductase
MHAVTLGGLTVSAEGLGCWGMSEVYGPTDWGQSIATIRRAIDLGITFLDTADAYGAGHNEVLVGRAIAGQRDWVQIATKVGIDRSMGAMSLRGEPAYIKRGCEASLLRLGVDVVDLYYLHRPPATNPIEESIGAMAELVAEGKVRRLGVSEVTPDQLHRAHATHPITAVQSEYSLWTRDPETLGTTDAMRGLGIGLVPYSPLGRGFFTATIDVDALHAGDMRRINPRFANGAAGANQPLLDAVRSIADDHDATPAQVSLAWVMAQSDRLGIPVVPIPGTKRVDRVEENARAVDLELSPAELASLGRLADGVVGARY